MSRIPVVLVTGFLGSGKTTLLRRLAEDSPGRRLLFLVNELATTDVDGGTLGATGIPTQSVVGGSLFCECKAGDFLRTLRETVLPAHHRTPVDLLVIETSGMADPEAIGHLMRDHGLERDFELRRIVTVVAPKTLARALGKLPVVEAQLRVSDLVVINKIDLVPVAEADAAEATVRALNPAAEIVRAEHCRFPFSLRGGLTELPRGALSTCEANPFSTALAVWPPERPLAQARAWLESLPPSILRVKGRIATPEGFFQLERTGDGLDVRSAPSGDGGLVLIAHDDDEAALLAAARALTPQPATNHD